LAVQAYERWWSHRGDVCSAGNDDGTTTVDYLVDAQNRRVGRKVDGTLVSGWLYQDQLRPVAQLDGSGTNVVARFVYGSKGNVPDYMVTYSGGTVAGTYRILSDHLGSPRLVVDVTSGNAIETINFDEFGVETETHGTLPTGYVRIPFGFAGGLYDPDTGLVRFGARDYNAGVGRWASKDPRRIGSRSFNLYSYAMNDPVNQRDPLGADDCSLVFTVVCTSVCAGAGAFEGPLGIAIGVGCSVVCGLIGVDWCDNPPPGPPPPPGPMCVPSPPPACDSSIASCP